ncbi:MAG: stalk domain-containing protein [Eubacteriales bacterium]
MKRQHILAFVLAAVLTVSGFAVGAANNQKIEAVLVNDVAFNVDGNAWSPKDVDGSPLTPIIYNGRTYVPVRSLLEDKGVTVGFDDKTRTVLLDYSTLIDKSTPLLFKTTPGAGNTFKDFTITRNRNFEPANLTMEQEYSFKLTDNATFTADGKALNLADAVRTKWTEELNSAKFEIDEKTGEVKSVTLTTLGDSDADQDQLKKVNITIEISGPPWKVKITIRF